MRENMLFVLLDLGYLTQEDYFWLHPLPEIFIFLNSWAISPLSSSLPFTHPALFFPLSWLGQQWTWMTKCLYSSI